MVGRIGGTDSFLAWSGGEGDQISESCRNETKSWFQRSGDALDHGPI